MVNISNKILTCNVVLGKHLLLKINVYISRHKSFNLSYCPSVEIQIMDIGLYFSG